MKSRIAYVVFIAILIALAYIGVQTDQKSFIGSLFAAFTSAFIVFFVEMELRPEIEIAREETPPVLADGRKFLRVKVTNRALWWPLKLIMDRRSANQVRAWLTFLTETNKPVFDPERRMIGRWASTPEPIRPIMVSQLDSENPGLAFLLDMSVTRDFIDIGSGNSEILDIVLRNPNEEGCAGWHNRIIQNPSPRPEDRFDLRMGRYHVKVRVDVSGRSYCAIFRIVCDVGIEDFRLEDI